MPWPRARWAARGAEARLPAGDAPSCAVSEWRRVEVASVPLSDAARKVVAGDGALIDTALTGGDDYEVVATVPVQA